MANLAQRVSDMLHSPKAQEMIQKVKAQANKPENKAKIQQITQKWKHRGYSSGGGRGPSRGGY